MNAWAIGRDPANWPDGPEEFNPDRFEANEVDIKGEHPILMPFGTGRRICPGMAMAMATVEFTLATLLFGFQWALPEGMVADDVSTERNKEASSCFSNRQARVKFPLCSVIS